MKKVIHKSILTKANICEMANVSTKELIDQVYNKFVNDFLDTRGYHNIESLGIPEDYGKNKTRIAKDKDSILIYLNGERKEIYGVEQDLSPSRTYVYSTNKLSKEIKQFYYNVCRGADNISYITCANKYIKYFEKEANFYSFENILENKENSKIFSSIPYLEKIKNDFISYKYDLQLSLELDKLKSFNDFDLNDIGDVNYKDKGQNILDLFSTINKITENKIWKSVDRASRACNTYANLHVEKYLSKEFIEKNTTKLVEKHLKEITKFYNNVSNFKNDFYTELYFLSTKGWGWKKDDVSVKSISNNIELKREKLNNYLKQF